MDKIFEEIKKERQRQDEIWGEQNHDLSVWATVLGEEYGEVCQEILEYRFHLNKPSGIFPELNTRKYINNLKEELIQVAAVVVATLEYIERNDTKIK